MLEKASLNQTVCNRPIAGWLREQYSAQCFKSALIQQRNHRCLCRHPTNACIAFFDALTEKVQMPPQIKVLVDVWHVTGSDQAPIWSTCSV